jgi:hypothetical protein
MILPYDVTRLSPDRHPIRWSWTCPQVRQERERLQQALEQGDAATCALTLNAASRMEGQEEVVTAMQRNVWREAVVRNMVRPALSFCFQHMEYIGRTQRVCTKASAWRCPAPGPGTHPGTCC